SLKPYILPPAELASIQNGQPTRTAVRSITIDRQRCETCAFCPSSHSIRLLTQKTRGTRAEIFCGVRSRPTILRTFPQTYRMENEVFAGSTPSIRAMSHLYRS